MIDTIRALDWLALAAALWCAYRAVRELLRVYREGDR